jgi:hypothetical protein
MKDFTPEKAQQVLALELPSQSDFGTVTVRKALTRLLIMMWDDSENFSGYRPLGNSDWTEQIIDSVIDAGLAPNWIEANSLVRHAIQYLSE